MKTAQQWQDELAGETSTQSIKQIQTDALMWAACEIFEELDMNQPKNRALYQGIIEKADSTINARK